MSTPRRFFDTGSEITASSLPTGDRVEALVDHGVEPGLDCYRHTYVALRRKCSVRVRWNVGTIAGSATASRR